MAAPKGTRPPAAGKGRPKGVPNKRTAALRELILGALDDAGGQEYLTRQAQNNPSAFLALLGKILPKKITGDPEQPLEVNTDPEERRRRAREEIDRAFAEREEQE